MLTVLDKCFLEERLDIQQAVVKRALQRLERSLRLRLMVQDHLEQTPEQTGRPGDVDEGRRLVE